MRTSSSATLLAGREDASMAAWTALLDGLTAGAGGRADDLGLIDLTRTMRDAAWAWVAAAEPDRRSSMEAQIRLARVAVGLNFAHKDIELDVRRRGFLYAMTELKAYLAFSGLDWPRSGPTLSL